MSIKPLDRYIPIEEMQLYHDRLVKAFESHADPELAQGMSAYMRNQFGFYGIPALLRLLDKQSVRKKN
jgi:3-methyladenine DNA glycosylase AlkD